VTSSCVYNLRPNTNANRSNKTLFIEKNYFVLLIQPYIYKFIIMQSSGYCLKISKEMLLSFHKFDWHKC